MTGPAWTRSSFCADSTCVEVTKAGGGYLLRDGKHPDQPALHLTAGDWARFLEAVTAGDYPA